MAFVHLFPAYMVGIFPIPDTRSKTVTPTAATTRAGPTRDLPLSSAARNLADEYTWIYPGLFGVGSGQLLRDVIRVSALT